MSKKKTTNEKSRTTGLASRRLLIVADSLIAGLDKLDTMPEWSGYDVPDNVAKDQHVSIVHYPAVYENGRRTFPSEGDPCGYAFAFNFDKATDHECLLLRQAFSKGYEVVAISTSDDTRGLPFAKEDGEDMRTNKAATSNNDHARFLRTAKRHKGDSGITAPQFARTLGVSVKAFDALRDIPNPDHPIMRAGSKWRKWNMATVEEFTRNTPK